jgi:hypothetical protein
MQWQMSLYYQPFVSFGGATITVKRGGAGRGRPSADVSVQPHFCALCNHPGTGRQRQRSPEDALQVIDFIGQAIHVFIRFGGPLGHENSFTVAPQKAVRPNARLSRTPGPNRRGVDFEPGGSPCYGL